MKRSRVDMVLDKLEQMGLGQLVMTDATSILYFAGIWVDAEERLVILCLSRHQDYCFFVDNMFNLLPDPGAKVVRFFDTDPYLEMLVGCTGNTKPLGMDRNMPTRFLLPLILMGYGTRYMSTSICANGVRVVRNEEEMEAMYHVSTINSRAMTEFKALLKKGVTEREVFNQTKGIHQKLGADNLFFPPFVCFGANAAIGHHHSGDVALKKGNCALLGVGCKRNSYCTDMTRAFFYGEIVKKEHRRVCELVLETSQATEAIIKPGVRLCDIDVTARRMIGDTGYGNRFAHRLGYFVGPEVHGFGDMFGANQETAVPDNIFSIEPGIYLEGDVEVRIEDLVLVTGTECEILNSYGKDLEIIRQGKIGQNDDRRVK